MDPISQYIACVQLEYAQDLERSMVRVFIRLLGRIPSKDEYNKRGMRFLLRQVPEGCGDASAFVWDGKLIVLSSGVQVTKKRATWWIREYV